MSRLRATFVSVTYDNLAMYVRARYAAAASIASPANRRRERDQANRAAAAAADRLSELRRQGFALFPFEYIGTFFSSFDLLRRRVQHRRAAAVAQKRGEGEKGAVWAAAIASRRRRRESNIGGRVPGALPP